MYNPAATTHIIVDGGGFSFRRSEKYLLGRRPRQDFLSRVGILGAGKMGAAIGKGLLKSGLVDRLVATDIVSDRLDAMKKMGIQVASNLEATRQSHTLIISVKPSQMDSLLDEVGPAIRDDHLVISIVAGIDTQYLETRLNTKHLMRAMPNINASVSQAITAISKGPQAGSADLGVAMALFDCVGTTVVVDEPLLDAVTGLSASGPAFIFTIIDALADAGVSEGMTYDLAYQLSIHMTLGAAKMLIETGMNPSELKRLVTTPGGTTIAGLREMELGGMRGIMIKAVEAATRRSREISSEVRESLARSQLKVKPKR